MLTKLGGSDRTESREEARTVTIPVPDGQGRSVRLAIDEQQPLCETVSRKYWVTIRP
jgi:hypothetical protein